MDYKAIHEKVVLISRKYQSSERELVEVLEEVNREKVYFKMGYTSLFTYCVDCLKLPQNQVYYLNGIAKKSLEIPLLKKAVTEGKVTVSAARRIVPVISKENQSEWIEKAATLPQRELERQIAKENPKAERKEKIQVLTEERSQLICGISRKLDSKIKRMKDVLSQKKRKAVTLEETLEFLVELGLEKIDPLERAKRAEKRASEPGAKLDLSSNQKPVLGLLDLSTGRKPVPAAARHAVWRRTEGQCAVDGCDATRWLDIHHKNPVSQGGGNDPENLELLCSAHHKLHHEQQQHSLWTF